MQNVNSTSRSTVDQSTASIEGGQAGGNADQPILAPVTAAQHSSSEINKTADQSSHVRSLCGGLEEDPLQHIRSSHSLQPDLPPILRRPVPAGELAAVVEVLSNHAPWVPNGEDKVGQKGPRMSQPRGSKETVMGITISEERKALLKWPALVLVCILGVGGSYNYDIPGSIGVGGSLTSLTAATPTSAADESTRALEASSTSAPSSTTTTTVQGLFISNGHAYNQKMNQSLYSAYSYPNMFFGIICGILIDKVIGLRKALLLFQLLALLGVTVTAISAIYFQQFSMMLLGRVVFGIGSESMWVVQSTTINRWFGEKDEGKDSDAIEEGSPSNLTPTTTTLRDVEMITPKFAECKSPVIYLGAASIQNSSPSKVGHGTPTAQHFARKCLVVDVAAVSISPTNRSLSPAMSAIHQDALTPTLHGQPDPEKPEKAKTNHGAAFAFGIMLSATRLQTSLTFWVLPRLAASSGVETAIGFGIFFSLVSFTCGILLFWLDTLAIKLRVLGPDHNREEKKVFDEDGSPKEVLALTAGPVSMSPTVPPTSTTTTTLPKKSIFDPLFANANAIAQLPLSFWLLSVIALLLYGSVLPFVGIAKNIFQVKYAVDDDDSATYGHGSEVIPSISADLSDGAASSSAADTELTSVLIPSIVESSSGGQNGSAEDRFFNPATYNRTAAEVEEESISNSNKKKTKGLSESEASTLVSVFQMICAAGSPVVGFVLDKTGKGQVWLFIAASILCLSSFMLITTPIPAMAAAISMATGYSIFCATLWPIVPLACPPKLRGLGYGLLAALNNCGMATIPLISGAILDAYSNDDKEISSESNSLPPFSAYQRVLALHCSLQALAMITAVILIVFYARTEGGPKTAVRRVLWVIVGRFECCRSSTAIQRLMVLVGVEGDVEADDANVITPQQQRHRKQSLSTGSLDHHHHYHTTVIPIGGHSLLPDSNNGIDSLGSGKRVYTRFNSNAVAVPSVRCGVTSVNSAGPPTTKNSANLSNCVTPMASPSVANHSLASAPSEAPQMPASQHALHHHSTPLEYFKHSFYNSHTTSQARSLKPPGHRPPVSPMSNAHSAGSSVPQATGQHHALHASNHDSSVLNSPSTRPPMLSKTAQRIFTISVGVAPTNGPLRSAADASARSPSRGGTATKMAAAPPASRATSASPRTLRGSAEMSKGAQQAATPSSPVTSSPLLLRRPLSGPRVQNKPQAPEQLRPSLLQSSTNLDIFTSSLSRQSPLRSPLATLSRRTRPASSPARPVFVVPPALTSPSRLAMQQESQVRKSSKKKKLRRKKNKSVVCTEEMGTVTDWSHEMPKLASAQTPEPTTKQKRWRKVVTNRQVVINKGPSSVVHVTSPKMIVAAPSTPSRKGRPSGNQSAMPQSVSVPVADDYYTYLEREEVEEVEELEEVEESEDEDCAESKVNAPTSRARTAGKSTAAVTAASETPAGQSLNLPSLLASSGYQFPQIPRSPYSNSGIGGSPQGRANRSSSISISSASTGHRSSLSTTEHMTASGHMAKRRVTHTMTSLQLVVAPAGDPAATSVLERLSNSSCNKSAVA